MTDQHELADGDLVRMLQAGDLEALAALYDRYSPQIYRTALALTYDSAAAEDVMQECFLRVQQYAHRINPDLPLAPWLYRVAVNCSHTWSRKYRRLMHFSESLIDLVLAPPRDHPERRAELSEIQRKVQKAIEDLPHKQRAVVVLYYFNGLSVKEIADIVDCSAATVKTRLFHARANLREVIEEGDITLPDVAPTNREYLQWGFV